MYIVSEEDCISLDLTHLTECKVLCQPASILFTYQGAPYYKGVNILEKGTIVNSDHTEQFPL